MNLDFLEVRKDQYKDDILINFIDNFDEKAREKRKNLINNLILKTKIHRENVIFDYEEILIQVKNDFEVLLAKIPHEYKLYLFDEMKKGIFDNIIFILNNDNEDLKIFSIICIVEFFLNEKNFKINIDNKILDSIFDILALNNSIELNICINFFFLVISRNKFDNEEVNNPNSKFLKNYLTDNSFRFNLIYKNLEIRNILNFNIIITTFIYLLSEDVTQQIKKNLVNFKIVDLLIVFMNMTEVDVFIYEPILDFFSIFFYFSQTNINHDYLICSIIEKFVPNYLSSLAKIFSCENENIKMKAIYSLCKISHQLIYQKTYINEFFNSQILENIFLPLETFYIQENREIYYIFLIKILHLILMVDNEIKSQAINNITTFNILFEIYKLFSFSLKVKKAILSSILEFTNLSSENKNLFLNTDMCNTILNEEFVSNNPKYFKINKKRLLLIYYLSATKNKHSFLKIYSKNFLFSLTRLINDEEYNTNDLVLNTILNILINLEKSLSKEEYILKLKFYQELDESNVYAVLQELKNSLKKEI